jgi:hypothetical protein
MLAVFEPLDRETLNEYFYHQMNNFSVISWREQVTFNEIMMITSLTRPTHTFG